MGGTLIKQARKMGVDIPPLTRPARASDRETLARACASQPSGPLESDEELGRIGRQGIKHIAVSGIRESNRLKANMALVALSQAKAAASAPLVSLVLNQTPSSDLESLEFQARQVLNASRGEDE